MTHIALISFLKDNLSIRLLSAYLKKNGFEVICLFCPGIISKKELESVISMLKDKEISLVGITLVTDDYGKAVMLTSAIKQLLAIPVIWGGAHPSVLPEESLKHADMVCIGEGEEALLELVQNLSSGKPSKRIKNIWFREGNNIVRNDQRDLVEDLDKYPFPDFNSDSQYVLNDQGFEKFSENHLDCEYNIMTSRGCPYSCCYCYNSYRRKQYSGKGRYLRLRSIENVMAELTQAKNMFGSLKKINFWDDSFVSRKTTDFITFKESYCSNINLPFFALIEPMAFDAEKIRILVDSHLVSVQIGIQSGSESVNHQCYHRFISNKDIIDMAKAVHRLGIVPIYDFIFNNPYETKEDLKKTVNLLLQFPKPFQLQGYNLIFYPGTEITRRALADHFIVEKPEGSEDFSRIQGEENSPVSVKNKSVASSRFYSPCYNSAEKTYFNSLIVFASFSRVPKWVIQFFQKSETNFKRFLLNNSFNLYTLLSRLKNKRFFS